MNRNTLLGFLCGAMIVAAGCSTTAKLEDERQARDLRAWSECMVELDDREFEREQRKKAKREKAKRPPDYPYHIYLGMSYSDWEHERFTGRWKLTAESVSDTILVLSYERNVGHGHEFLLLRFVDLKLDSYTR